MFSPNKTLRSNAIWFIALWLSRRLLWAMTSLASLRRAGCPLRPSLSAVAANDIDVSAGIVTSPLAISPAL